MYKDRYGNTIKTGDIVLRAITLNQQTFRGFTSTVNIVRKEGRVLILDGVHAWACLKDIESAEMVKITPDTNLRRVESEFIRDFRLQ